MKKSLFFLIILLSALFETTFLNSFRIFGVKPDLLLICVVTASLNFGIKTALVLSAFAGILKDSLTAAAFGLNLLLFVLWSFLLRELAKRISLDNRFFCAGLVCIIILVNNIVARPLYFFLIQLSIPLGVFLRTTILEAVYTGVVSAWIFKFWLINQE